MSSGHPQGRNFAIDANIAKKEPGKMQDCALTTKGKEADTVSDELLVAAEGAVRIVTINRPQSHNVINESLHCRLVDVWRDLDRDAGARCVVLTGAGATFSGGGDFAFLKAQHRSLPLRHEIAHQAGAILNAMINFRLPVVAAVNGPAVGLGASLALCCDLVLMSERSYLAIRTSRSA